MTRLTIDELGNWRKDGCKRSVLLSATSCPTRSNRPKGNALKRKRFGLVNRVERSFWGTSLAVLHKEGSDAVAKYKKDFFDPWGEYN